MIRELAAKSGWTMGLGSHGLWQRLVMAAMVALLGAGCESAATTAGQTAFSSDTAEFCLDGNKYKGPRWQCVPFDIVQGGGTADAGTTAVPDVPDNSCQRKCDGKACGDDGCGGTCGVCTGAGVTCSAAGQCATCQPSCSGKTCGSDGCGGVCGKCIVGGATPHCGSEGQCVATCTPNCKTGGCGSDGCGGSCGTCAAGKSCILQQCITTEQIGSCAGKCGGNADGNTCSCQADCAIAGNCCPDFATACTCVPDCKNKTCGSNGCGGSCGSCTAGTLCGSANSCVDNLCDPDPCGGRGTCNPDNGACTCNAGFAGAKCDSCAPGLLMFPTCGPPVCNANTCNGQGTCNETTGACTCKPAFVGPTCNQCKFASEVWPNCTCAGDTCGACTAGGCDDGNPCTTDSCDSQGACVHNSPCDFGQISMAAIAPWSGPAVPTEAAPLTMTLPGTTATTVKFAGQPDGLPVTVVSPAKNAGGGKLVGGFVEGIKVAGGAFQVVRLGTSATKPSVFGVSFSQPAASLGAGKHYVIGVGGLGGSGEGPLKLSFFSNVVPLGQLDTADSSITAKFVDNALLEGPTGGPPTMLQLFAIPTNAVDLGMYVQTDAADTLDIAVGVVQLGNYCDVAAGKCASAAAKCGDGKVQLAEACDDGNAEPNDGCETSCVASSGFTCKTKTGLSTCLPTCSVASDCEGLEVFWNDINTTLKGTGKALAVDDATTTIAYSIPFQQDGKSQAAGVTASLVGTGSVGAPTGAVFQEFAPPTTSSGQFNAAALGKKLVWKGSIPYLDLLPGDPMQYKLRLQFAKTAAALGPDYRYVLGVAGTSGPTQDGPVTVVSSVPLEDVGTLDAFETGKVPALVGTNTIVGSKNTVADTDKPDGFRFVLLPAGADTVDLSITSPAVDPHGYAVGLVRLQPRTCLEGQCVAVPPGCGDGKIGSGETCDDGNAIAGDGCSLLCTTEAEWTCVTKPAGSVCTKTSGCIPTCGDKKCGDNGCGGTCGTCDPGSVCTGAGTCADDPCQPDPCNGHGTCDAQTGACTCTAKYTGTACDQCAAGLENYPTCSAINLCAGDPCNGHGTCDPQTGACTCEQAFAGTDCSSCKFSEETWPNCTCYGEKCPDCALTGCNDNNGCTTETCNEDGTCSAAPLCGNSEVTWFNTAPLTEETLIPTGQAAQFEIVVNPPLPVQFVRGADWVVSPGPVLPAGTATPVAPVTHALAWSGSQAPIQVSSFLDGGSTPAAIGVNFIYPASSLVLPWVAEVRYVVGIAGLSGSDGAADLLVQAGTLQEVGRVPWQGSETAALWDPLTQILSPVNSNPTQMQLFLVSKDTEQLVLELAQQPNATADYFMLMVGLVDLGLQCQGSGSQASCVSTNSCGDGLKMATEDCDDGNQLPGDGCSADCAIELNQSCNVPVLTSQCTAGPPAGHPCDDVSFCGSPNPHPSFGCYCSAECLQFGDCCQFDGTPGGTCAGSTCGACQM
jgi:cysteine-rich repeat protein